jgi:hypothetical protein
MQGDCQTNAIIVLGYKELIFSSLNGMVDQVNLCHTKPLWLFLVSNGGFRPAAKCAGNEDAFREPRLRRRIQFA